MGASNERLQTNRARPLGGLRQRDRVTSDDVRETLSIGERFHAYGRPPAPAHAGYAAGIIARNINGPAEVKVRKPVPTGRSLSLMRTDKGAVQVLDGDTVLAVGKPTRLELEVPEPVSYADTERAARWYLRLAHLHPAPWCFVCGPKRAERDGLRIFTAPVEGRDVVAARWTPDASLADSQGSVSSEYVWAALDCPGVVSFWAPGDQPVTYGMAVEILRCVIPGERYLVMGWFMGAKLHRRLAGTALLTEAGEVLATARTTFALLNPDRRGARMPRPAMPT